ncbi:MAG: hypothetical protein QGH60_11175 [Phycisphaerae bacterium]|jgi:hypothetical protein|nr:hypothetical protein [Phycisphaerae bacterium]
MTPTDTAAPPADAKGGYRNDIQSGKLTAGSFDDTREPKPYNTFVSGLTDGSAIADLAKTCHSKPIVIQVRDTSGRPVGGATVKIDRGRDAPSKPTVRTSSERSTPARTTRVRQLGSARRCVRK